MLGLGARAVPTLTPLIGVADVVGTVFINGIRMVVMPLVVGLVISGIGSTAGAKVLAGVRWRALTVAALPALGALFALAAGSWLFAVLPIDADAARDHRRVPDRRKPLAAVLEYVHLASQRQASRRRSVGGEHP